MSYSSDFTDSSSDGGRRSAAPVTSVAVKHQTVQRVQHQVSHQYDDSESDDGSIAYLNINMHVEGSYSVVDGSSGGWNQWQQEGTATTRTQTHIKLGDAEAKRSLSPPRPVPPPQIVVVEKSVKKPKPKARVVSPPPSPPPRRSIPQYEALRMDALRRKKGELLMLIQRDLAAKWASRSSNAHYDSYQTWSELLDGYTGAPYNPHVLVRRAIPRWYRQMKKEHYEQWLPHLDPLLAYGRRKAGEDYDLPPEYQDIKITHPDIRYRPVSAKHRSRVSPSPARRPVSAKGRLKRESQQEQISEQTSDSDTSTYSSDFEESTSSQGKPRVDHRLSETDEPGIREWINKKIIEHRRDYAAAKKKRQKEALKKREEKAKKEEHEEKVTSAVDNWMKRKRKVAGELHRRKLAAWAAEDKKYNSYRQIYLDANKNIKAPPDCIKRTRSQKSEEKQAKAESGEKSSKSTEQRTKLERPTSAKPSISTKTVKKKSQKEIDAENRAAYNSWLKRKKEEGTAAKLLIKEEKKSLKQDPETRLMVSMHGRKRIAAIEKSKKTVDTGIPKIDKESNKVFGKQLVIKSEKVMVSEQNTGPTFPLARRRPKSAKRKTRAKLTKERSILPDEDEDVSKVEDNLVEAPTEEKLETEVTSVEEHESSKETVDSTDGEIKLVDDEHYSEDETVDDESRHVDEDERDEVEKDDTSSSQKPKKRVTFSPFLEQLTGDAVEETFEEKSEEAFEEKSDNSDEEKEDETEIAYELKPPSPGSDSDSDFVVSLESEEVTPTEMTTSSSIVETHESSALGTEVSKSEEVASTENTTSTSTEETHESSALGTEVSKSEEVTSTEITTSTSTEITTSTSFVETHESSAVETEVSRSDSDGPVVQVITKTIKTVTFEDSGSTDTDIEEDIKPAKSTSESDQDF